MGAEPRVTCYFFDLMTLTPLPRVPVNELKFGLRLNTAGTFGCTINMAGVDSASALAATIPGRTILVIDVGGQPVWGGIVWTRTFQKSTRILTLAGNEADSYWLRRNQAADYTVPPFFGLYWNTNPAPSEWIAQQIITDTQATPGTGFGPEVMTVALAEEYPNGNGIVGSFPISQVQQVDQLVNTLSAGGYGTGFDYYTMPNWTGQPGSAPHFTYTLAYPRAGRTNASSGVTIVLGRADDYTWPEDASAQAWSNFGTGGPGGILQNVAIDPTPGDDGWPLLEATTSYANVNTQSAIVAASEGDTANAEWPIVTPPIILDMFGDDLALTDIVIGDDAHVINAGDERFPEGFDTYMRIIAIDGTVNDAGRSTMTLTLNMPPALAPVPPPPGI